MSRRSGLKQPFWRDVKVPATKNSAERCQPQAAAHGGRQRQTRINAKHDTFPHDRRVLAPSVRADFRPAARRADTRPARHRKGKPARDARGQARLDAASARARFGAHASVAHHGLFRSAARTDHAGRARRRAARSKKLDTLHRFVYAQLGDEMLWNNSMPGLLPDTTTAFRSRSTARSNIGKLKYVYRLGLALRYGRTMQCIAGIHYNYSLNEEVWRLLHARPAIHRERRRLPVRALSRADPQFPPHELAADVSVRRIAGAGSRVSSAIANTRSTRSTPTRSIVRTRPACA